MGELSTRDNLHYTHEIGAIPLVLHNRYFSEPNVKLWSLSPCTVHGVKIAFVSCGVLIRREGGGHIAANGSQCQQGHSKYH